MPEKIILKTVFFFLTIIFSVNSQTKSNLEIYYNLIDSSASKVVDNINTKNEKISLNLTLGESYSLFENHLISAFTRRGYNITNNSEDKDWIKINYVLDNVQVNYKDMFRDGFLGSYLTPRVISVSGNYLISKDSHIYEEYYYTYTDTIRVDNIKEIENLSYPFTMSDIPEEPFFSSLFEPIIAIGTAAIAVYLFFTIRSN